MPAVLSGCSAGAKLPVTAYDRSDSDEARRPARWRRSTTRSTPRPAPSSCARVRQRRRGACFRTSSSMCGCWSTRCSDATLVPDRGGAARRRPAPMSTSSRPDNTVSVRPVKVGADRRRAHRRSLGPEPGDQVVVDGADRLRDGAKVDRTRADDSRPRPPTGAAPARADIGRRRRRRPRQATRDDAAVGRRAMNPSRLFILRPVATTLLMVAILLVGARRLSASCRSSALPEVDYPTIQVQTFYPGASPEVMTSVGHRAAGAPVRPDARPEPDVVDELGRRLGHHPAVRSRSQPRRRRAGSPGGDQRRRQPAAGRPAGAADLRQGQSRRRADPDAGASPRRPCR